MLSKGFIYVSKVLRRPLSVGYYTEVVYASLSSRIRSILCEIRPSVLEAVKVGFKSLYLKRYNRLQREKNCILDWTDQGPLKISTEHFTQSHFVTSQPRENNDFL